MIENLDGIHETVEYKEHTHLRLYDNREDEDYPLHWHRPMEIVMPLENDYQVSVNDKTYHLKPYDIILICPGVIHRITSPKEGRRFIFQADLSVIHDIYGLQAVMSFLNPVALFTPETAPTVHNDLKELMMSIADEYLSSQDLYVPSPMKTAPSQMVSENNLGELSIYSSLIKMITIVGRAHIQKLDNESDNINKQQEYIRKFMTICDYIDNHYQEDISLQDMADMSGFSKYHFSRLFHEFTNMSFYRYVNRHRISHAEYLLTEENLSATQAAIQSGFSSQSAFIRMFKSFNGCTPREFKKMQQGI